LTRDSAGGNPYYQRKKQEKEKEKEKERMQWGGQEMMRLERERQCEPEAGQRRRIHRWSDGEEDCCGLPVDCSLLM
jgi:hypothetical protein